MEKVYKIPLLKASILSHDTLICCSLINDDDGDSDEEGDDSDDDEEEEDKYDKFLGEYDEFFVTVIIFTPIYNIYDILINCVYLNNWLYSAKSAQKRKQISDENPLLTAIPRTVNIPIDKDLFLIVFCATIVKEIFGDKLNMNIIAQ